MKEKPAGVVGDSGEGDIEIEDGWDDLIDDSGQQTTSSDLFSTYIEYIIHVP